MNTFEHLIGAMATEQSGKGDIRWVCKKVILRGDSVNADVKAWSMYVSRGQYFLRIIAQAIWCWQKLSCSANAGKIIIKVKSELRQW